MPITEADVISFSIEFHNAAMVKKATAAEQAEYFLYPDSKIILPHSTDLTLQQHYEAHQALIDESIVPQKDWEITPLCSNPERVRAVGRMYWEARMKTSTDTNAKIKCLVGEDWIIQRMITGELKFVIYMNTFHFFLPDSAPLSL